MTDSHADWTQRYIQAYYDQRAQVEWERLERHRTELAVTLRVLDEYMPPSPARVLDCGGGPGRYAIELARRGYRVTLFDLSPESLRLARARADGAGVALEGYEQGTATDLSRFAEGSFDVVLLMGPLYHLLRASDRGRALAEAQRVLKPGGTLCAAFIARYAALRYAAVHEPAWPLEESERVAELLDSGVCPPMDQQGSSFAAHFAHPSSIAPLLWGSGFELLAVFGVEGLVSMIEEQVNTLSGDAWQRWIELNYRAAGDPSIHGCVEHLLAVAVNPLWKAMLRHIARTLGQAGIRYKVVGGASVALHGLPLRVRDLDLEMTPQGTYAFQALFPDRVTLPVELREGETYRSHFGRFDFGGLQVEVMGDLHRRQGDTWVPTMTQTEAIAELDGLRIPISWLEEETLAYIRRGRLDRAALCLPHCDHRRLLSLLRREQPTCAF